MASLLFGFTIARGVALTPIVIGLIGLGVALCAFWIVLELRIKNPMVNLRLFKQRQLVLSLIITALVGLGIFATGGLIGPILQQGPVTNPVGLGLTPTQAGLYGLITGAVGFILSPIGGRVAAKFGAKVTLGIGISVAVLGFAGFAFFVHDLPLAITATVVSGVGTALILAGLPNLIVELVDPQNTGEAIGIIYSTGRTIFQAIGTTVAGLILASSVVESGTASTLQAWYGVIAFIVITGLIALVATIIVKKVNPMDQRGEVIEAVAEVQAEAADVSATPVR